MFTGLVADIGTIAALSQTGSNWSVNVRTSFDMSTIELGESIAIDGACLTVTKISGDCFSVDASPETLKKTTLGQRKVGQKVHLERALRIGDRLGGHFVLGHVDGLGTIRAKSREKNAWLFDVEAPAEIARYLIDKGSITVDGVSLTVNWVDKTRFGLAIIPFTLQKTNFSEYSVGRMVNLEADVLGKYVAKFMGSSSGEIDWPMLKEFGFL